MAGAKDTPAAEPTPTPTMTTTTASNNEGLIIARLGAQRAKYKSERDATVNELNVIKAERDKLLTENTTLKTKADTSVLAKENQALQQKLRTIDHKKVFDRIALAKGARADMLDDLFELSKYEAKADEIDEEVLTGLIDEQKKSRTGFFGKPQEGEPKPEKAAPIVKPAVGSGQGKPDADPSRGDIIIKTDDPRRDDAAWQMKNFDKLVASANERFARGEL
jgi:hypothetical protein